MHISLPPSRQEIADLIGTTLETAIRLMSRWQKDSIVITEKNGFFVPDAMAPCGRSRARDARQVRRQILSS